MVFAGKRNASLALLVTVLTFSLTLSPMRTCYAQNQALPPLSDGTELIVTDEASEVILGYGTVQGGRLELNLSATTATMVVLFISPNGSFTTLRGYLGEDRRLWLTDDAMQALTNLESLSQNANIALRVSGVAADAFVAGDDDDDRLRPPEQLAQPTTRPADGAGNAAGAASSRIGIGTADQTADQDDANDNSHNQTTVSRNPEEQTPEDQSDVSVGVDNPANGSSDMPSSPDTPATPAPSKPEIEISDDDAGSPDDGDGLDGETAGDEGDVSEGEDVSDDTEEEDDDEEDEGSDDQNDSESSDNTSNEDGEGDD